MGRKWHLGSRWQSFHAFFLDQHPVCGVKCQQTHPKLKMDLMYLVSEDHKAAAHNTVEPWLLSSELMDTQYQDGASCCVFRCPQERIVGMGRGGEIPILTQRYLSTLRLSDRHTLNARSSARHQALELPFPCLKKECYNTCVVPGILMEAFINLTISVTRTGWFPEGSHSTVWINKRPFKVKKTWDKTTTVTQLT